MRRDAPPSVQRQILSTRRWLQAHRWLRCALQHTWAGALAFLVAGVGLGAALDRWMPEAQSLPHAVKLWRSH